MGFLDTRPLDAAWHLWLHVAPLDDSTLIKHTSSFSQKTMIPTTELGPGNHVLDFRCSILV